MRIEAKIERIKGESLAAEYFMIVPTNLSQEDAEDLIVSDYDKEDAVLAFMEGATEKYGEEVEVVIRGIS